MDNVKSEFKTVDEYIALFSGETQERLKIIRKIALDIVPNGTEHISYKMPTIKVYGKFLIYYAAWTDHIALYPATGSLEKSIKEVLKYKTGKGTLKFPLNEPLPIDLIKQIVQVRVKENKEKSL